MIRYPARQVAPVIHRATVPAVGNRRQIAFQHRHGLRYRYVQFSTLSNLPFENVTRWTYLLYRIHQNSVVWGNRNSEHVPCANNLRAVNMPERDVVGWWKVCAGNASSVPI